MINEKITLYNGVKVPVLGLGTWMIDDDKVKEVVSNMGLAYNNDNVVVIND